MKNYFDGLKNQISTFCIGADGFWIFLLLNCLKKYFLSSCLLLWKHLLILDILLETAEESPPTPPFNSAFEKADNQSSARYEK